jgi:hypothetical protein
VGAQIAAGEIRETGREYFGAIEMAHLRNKGLRQLAKEWIARALVGELDLERADLRISGITDDLAAHRIDQELKAETTTENRETSVHQLPQQPNHRIDKGLVALHDREIAGTTDDHRIVAFDLGDVGHALDNVVEVKLLRVRARRSQETLALVREHRIRRETALQNEQSHNSGVFRDMIADP